MRVRILDAATGMVMAGYEGAELRRHLGGPGATAETGVIAPGMRRVVYLGVPLTGAPGKLLHRIEFHADGGAPAQLDAGAVNIDRQPVPVLGPPLPGGHGVAGYEPAVA